MIRAETMGSRASGCGGLFLTAGADVQKDRIEVDVWAWGPGRNNAALVDPHRDRGGPDPSGGVVG